MSFSIDFFSPSLPRPSGSGAGGSLNGLSAESIDVLMNAADVPATRLIQPGSRVSYRLLAAGEAIDAFRAEAAKRLGRGERIQGVRDARPEVRATLEKAQQFLGLALFVGASFTDWLDGYIARKRAFPVSRA